MSQPSSTHPNPDKPRSKSSRLWIALSLLISALIIGWAFTAPFRQPGTPLVSSKPANGNAPQLDSSDQILQPRTSGEEYRAAAIARDQEFMRSLARKRQIKTDAPGRREVKRRWNRRVEQVKKELAQLKGAEKGSLEWQYRQELVESIRDDRP